MILDATAGKRGIWYDKKNDETVYMDIRKEVEPDIVADVKHLPFKDQIFDLVIFDPPHANFSENAQMSERYGYFTTRQITAAIKKGAIEFNRVLNGNGMVLFKWNTHSQRLRRVIAFFEPNFKPLFGQKVAYKLKHASSTYWVCLKRRNKPLTTLTSFAHACMHA